MFISKKHIDSKPNEMIGTDIKLNSCVNTIGEAFHGKNASLIDPTKNVGVMKVLKVY